MSEDTDDAIDYTLAHPCEESEEHGMESCRKHECCRCGKPWPKGQQAAKHEKKSARSTYCRCGYPWIGDRCASPDVERPESQEKPKEEA